MNAAPPVVRQPNHPSFYQEWEEERRKLWDKIPFDANEYYMHYLPPGIVPRPSEWNPEEISEFQSLLLVRMIE